LRYFIVSRLASTPDCPPNHVAKQSKAKSLQKLSGAICRIVLDFAAVWLEKLGQIICLEEFKNVLAD
jgi:hypothetical protein